MDKGASSYHLFLMGDQKGFCQIVYDYYDGLVLYLNTWLNNLYDAEDMAQETLVVLVSQKPVFKGKSSFKTWLYSIGRNVTIAYMRKNHRLISVSPEELTVLVSKEQNAAKEYFQSEEKKSLHRCLVRLKPEYRRVLWLDYFEEMPASEIARAMGKTVYGVNHLVRRAKEALRREMEKEGYRTWQGG